MDAARPRGAREPYQFPGGDPMGDIEAEQPTAFEAEVDEWWRVVPAPEGADPMAWHYHEEH